MFRPNAMQSRPGYGFYLERDVEEEAYWTGEAARLLELEGRNMTKEFDLLRAGVDPNTGEVLRPRQRYDTRDGEGKFIGLSRSAYDGVVMAPKSISVMNIFDSRLAQAHKEATEYLHTAMERLAMTRVRRDGLDENRFTHNVATGVFRHGTSRELDPHIHTHLAVVNITYDAVENRWKALQAIEILRHRHEMTEVYRIVLAKRVQEMGYQVENKLTRSAASFEIRGVPEDVLARFSTRRSQIDEVYSAFREHHGRNPTPREEITLVRRHRPDKINGLDHDQIRERQLQRLAPGERQGLMDLRERALERQAIYEVNVPYERISGPRQIESSEGRNVARQTVYDIYPAQPYNREPQGAIAGQSKPPEVDKDVLNAAMKFVLADKVHGEGELSMHPWTYGDEKERDAYRMGNRSQKMRQA